MREKFCHSCENSSDTMYRVRLNTSKNWYFLCKTCTEENKTNKNKCSGKGKAMFTYGIIQLGSNVVSAIALAAIAISFCNLKQESKVFNECIEEVKATGKSTSNAVRFCNGGL